MKIETRIIRAEDHEIANLLNVEIQVSSIENFLKQEAYFLTIDKECSTTLAFLGDDLVGFFSLRKSTVDIESDGEITKIPCLDIARIAVASEYQNRGIGSKLLARIFDLAETVNEKYITLEALIEKYEWYKKKI
ncbi:GNAT family N-acetyltransferase [Planococcus lenghuensis]|uniref:N-acetyltransferase domain-containing protein n=1 Tax=Planococcus lenghuensis TaxID=2213202 RepID=A0A1Q2KVU7_9BACL|nr:GNAT family N-acetyltransferase [Planococcus lenghuensis]AQQ52263.1 hypothetical protein B0X71_03470 [Planococcus lenghuensis]